MLPEKCFGFEKMFDYGAILRKISRVSKLQFFPRQLQQNLLYSHGFTMHYYDYILIGIHDKHIPTIIAEIEKWVLLKKSRTYIPPAFYERELLPLSTSIL